MAKIYVDGALISENDSFTFTPAAVGATVNDWLGRSQYNDPYFYGTIDEFRIYSAALSAQQVAQDYQLGPNVSPQTGPVKILTQPPNVMVTEQQPATFNVGYIGHRAVTFQWYRNGSPISGATNSSYQLASPMPLDGGAVFYVALTNSVTGMTYTALSSNAVLTVFPDTNAPLVVRVFNVGLTNVVVVYSKLVEAASATNVGNYGFTNGLGVTGAALGADNVTVMLTTGPLSYGSNYWLVISNVRDRAAIPNTIAPNTTVWLQPLPYAPQDLGNPTTPATVAVAGNGLAVLKGYRWGPLGIGLALDRSTNQTLATGDDCASRDCVRGVAAATVFMRAEALMMKNEPSMARSRTAASP